MSIFNTVLESEIVLNYLKINKIKKKKSFLLLFIFECHQFSTNKMEKYPTEVILMHKIINEIFLHS